MTVSKESGESTQRLDLSSLDIEEVNGFDITLVSITTSDESVELTLNFLGCLPGLCSPYLHNSFSKFLFAPRSQLLYHVFSLNNHQWMFTNVHSACLRWRYWSQLSKIAVIQRSRSLQVGGKGQTESHDDAIPE